MIKSAVLHIGTEKTGSTAIQKAGEVHRAAFSEIGVCYPRVPGEKNHIGFTLMSVKGPGTARLQQLIGLKTDDEYNRYLAGFWENAERELLASGCHTYVCSNEHLSSRVFEADKIKKIAEFLSKHAETVKVVLYLRPQHELLASYYSTRVKSGFTKSLEDIIPQDETNEYYNYLDMIDRWAYGFGAENVVVKRFDRSSLLEGDVVKDFYVGEVGVPSDFKFEDSPPVNQSLDAPGAEFLRLFNQFVPNFADGVPNRDRAGISNLLSEMSFGQKLAVSGEKGRAIMDMFAESNAEVARKYFHQDDGVLFPKLKFDGVDPQPLTAELAVKIAAELWRKKAGDWRGKNKDGKNNESKNNEGKNREGRPGEGRLGQGRPGGGRLGGGRPGGGGNRAGKGGRNRP